MARNQETNISHEILLELSGPDCLAWKQTVGAFRAVDNPQRIVQVGVPGLSDIMTVVAVEITPAMVGKTIGVAMALEAKTTKGKQRESQENFQKAFEKRGGIYRIVRSAEDAAGALTDVKSGNWVTTEEQA